MTASTVLPAPRLWMTIPMLIGLVVGVIGFVFGRVVDPDTFWHVRAGEWIVQHRQLPTTDLFLKDHAQTPWVLHEWLFQVLLVPFHRMDGLEGLRWLNALGALALFAAVQAWAKRKMGALPAAFAALVVVLPTVGFWVARPQMASCVIYVMFLMALLHFYDRGSWRSLALIPVLVALWVNLHGAYMLALAMMVLAVAAAVVDWMVVPRVTMTRHSRSIRPLLGVLVLSVLAAGLNPYGYPHLLYPLDTMQLAAVPKISEWAAPSWKDLGSVSGLAAFLVFVVFQSYRRRPSPALDWFVVLPLFLMSLKSNRHVVYLILTVGIVLLHRWDERPAWITGRVGSKHGRGAGQLSPPKPEASATVKSIAHAALAVAVLAFVPGLASKSMQAQVDFCQTGCGTSAIDFIKEKGLQGPILNEYSHGGYITYALWPTQKAFIDGRPDMYRDDFTRAYFVMHDFVPGWRQEFDKHGFNLVVMPKKRPILAALKASGEFESVYTDAWNEVIVRKAPLAPLQTSPQSAGSKPGTKP
jgi:hypothetical protein